MPSWAGLLLTGLVVLLAYHVGDLRRRVEILESILERGLTFVADKLKGEGEKPK